MSSLQQAPALAPAQAPAAPTQASQPAAVGSDLSAERASLAPASGVSTTPTLDLAAVTGACQPVAGSDQLIRSITEAMERLHECKRDALAELEKELSLIPPPPLFPEALVTASTIALSAAAAGVGGLIGATLVASSTTALRAGLKKAFEKAVELTTKETVHAAGGATLKTPGISSVDAFCGVQRDGLGAIDWATIDEFIMTTGPLRPDEFDDAVELKRTLLGSIDEVAAIQRSASLQAWCVYEAQAELGAGDDGTDLHDALHGSDPEWMAFMSNEPRLDGVLQLEVEGTSPHQPLRIRSARLAGLTPALAAELAATSLSDLEIPVVVHGVVDVPDDRLMGKSHFHIGRNEQGMVWCEIDHSGGLDYLRAKAGHDAPGPGSSLTDPGGLDGRFDWARAVLEGEILKSKLADLGVAINA